MKFIIKTAAIAALALAAAGAQAEWHGELGYSALNVDGSGTSVDLGALSGTIGYGLHENFAVEGMLAFGVKDDQVGGAKVELEHSYGIFAKPRIMLSPNFELFGRIGYVESKLKASAPGYGSLSDTDGDWAYGVGGNYYFDRNSYLNASYLRFYDKDGIRGDGLTIGLGMKF
jgi:hypothetical protein